jgi:hypothetical protein
MPNSKLNMNTQLFKIWIIITGVVPVLSGCATTHDTEQHAPKSAVQSNTGPTVSGYIDIGAGKKLQ